MKEQAAAARKFHTRKPLFFDLLAQFALAQRHQLQNLLKRQEPRGGEAARHLHRWGTVARFRMVCGLARLTCHRCLVLCHRHAVL